MGGGLLQLVCRGQQDIYLCENPDISFFKYAYKKHTRFAIENIKLEFDKLPTIEPEIIDAEYNCKIDRIGDLLKNLYFCCTLPAIYSSSNLAFKWVKNIGHILIKKTTIKIDGIVIDTLTSDWLNIWNELTIDTEGYNQMIGNIDSLTNPSLTSKKKIILKNNKFIYNYYPNSSITDRVPSINSYDIVVPLSFWFTKNPSLALPLLRLQANEVILTIQFENSENLYTVYSDDLEENISPLFYNELYSKNLENSNIIKRPSINIKSFIKTNIIYPYIEASYVFLGDKERNTILNKVNIQYLVEQINITSQTPIPANKNSITNITVNTNKPTKEIIWIIRREDYKLKFNSHSNYMASFRNNNDYEILNRASIIWDKSKIIVDEKKGIFFNKIQPYNSHSIIPISNGLYLYSFALNPEKNNPSGFYNAALVDTKLALYVNKYNITDELYNLNIKINKHNKFTELQIDSDIKNYLVDIYSVSYNIFEIIGRSAGMKFA